MKYTIRLSNDHCFDDFEVDATCVEEAIVLAVRKCEEEQDGLVYEPFDSEGRWTHVEDIQRDDCADCEVPYDYLAPVYKKETLALRALHAIAEGAKDAQAIATEALIDIDNVRR
jgi:hypothetical protein